MNKWAEVNHRWSFHRCRLILVGFCNNSKHYHATFRFNQLSMWGRQVAERGSYASLHHIWWPDNVNHLYILAFARLWCSFWDHHKGSNHCQILSLSWQMSLLLASLASLPWIAESYSQLLGPICYWSWTSMLTCTWIVYKKRANTFSKRKVIFLI